MQSSPLTTWTWVRHAPSTMSGRFCGQSDPELDATKTQDYGPIAGALAKEYQVYVSPLIRATQTLDRLVRAGFRPGAICTSALIVEQNFGRLEGERYDSVALPDSAEGLATWQPPDGESFAELVARVRSFMAQERRKTSSADVSVICHAGVIRAALAVALDIAPSHALAFAIEPLSRTALTLSSGGHWQVAYVNRTGAI